MVALELLVFPVVFGLLYFFKAVWEAMTYWKVRGVKHLSPWPVVGNLGRLLKMDKHLTYYYNQGEKSTDRERYEIMANIMNCIKTKLGDRLGVPMKSYFTLTKSLKESSKNNKNLNVRYHSINYEKSYALDRNKYYRFSFSLGMPRNLPMTHTMVTTHTHDFLYLPCYFLAIMVNVIVNHQQNCHHEFIPSSSQGASKSCTKTAKRFSNLNGQGCSNNTVLPSFQKLSEFFGMKFMPNDLDEYFRSLMNTLLNQREKINPDRNDYAQVLMEMRKLNKMNVYNRENNKIDETFEMTNDIALSQAFMFFFAGLDTTSLLMLHLAFELSLAKECQEKARQEVRSVLKKYGGYSWEAVRDMKYLDQCIQEALRKHPSLQFVVRICDKDTILDGVKIQKGNRIVVPIHSIQMDPKNYPEPHKYNPDRFHESNLRNKFLHIPFSDGPRVCIGKKFATMETATLFAHLLDNFEMSPSSDTKIPLQYEPNALFLTPIAQNPISVTFKKIV